MWLAKIDINNFKGLSAATFAPAGFACLVGENNAGKSSVLQAVVTALTRPPQLPSSLFYDSNLPIEFFVTFTGITDDHLARLAEEHRPKLAAILGDQSLTLVVRYKPQEKVAVTVMRRLPRDNRYRQESLDSIFLGKRGAAVRDTLNATFPEFSIADETILTLGVVKAHINARIRELPADAFEQAESPLPSGIPSSITALLPEPIYIPAVKNLSDDLKTSQSTSFGRLLGLLLEDMAPDLGTINESLATLNSLFNRVVEGGEEVDRRHVKVRELESLVETLLSQNFPRVKVELKVPPPELRAILNTAQIFIDDGSKDIVDNKGDGIKRSLTFALLQAYVQHLSQAAQARTPDAPAPRPLIFLFEEPELYLHPRSQRILFNTLAQIANAHQVVVTTHSPMFFAPGVTASFVRIAKQNANPKPVSAMFPVTFEPNPALAESFHLARFEHADAAFFSRRVVLFEGESDDSYCKHVAKTLNAEWDFEQQNVALVRVSGKGNFTKFRNFFSAFGIEVKLVADLDAIFDGYQHLGASAVCTALRTTLLRTLDERIATVGLRSEPNPRQIKARVHQESWRDRYQRAKGALRDIQTSGVVDAPTIALLDELFTWEQEVARVRICCEDNEAANAVVPLLDALRQEGICVLSRGAIEDYYPAGAPGSGPKPERAIAAASLITSPQIARTLSQPLGEGRSPELEETFEELFRGL